MPIDFQQVIGVANNKPKGSDAKAKWRRCWRAVHSPYVLIPSCCVCTTAAIADVPIVVVEFGWGLGALFAVFLVSGVAISLFDLAPHLVRWLVEAHRWATATLAAVSGGLERLAASIREIVADD